MGIRIEDSVCVQEDHPLVLTTEAVKEVCGSGHMSWRSWLTKFLLVQVDDIEALRR